MLSRAEIAVYFRLARGFAWFLLVVVTLGLVADMIVLVPEFLQAAWAPTSVSSRDLERALASPASIVTVSDEAEAQLNPAEMARLDQIAYEIINLLPVNVRPQAREQVDALRGNIRNEVANLSKDRSEQLAILSELRDSLGGIPDPERSKAMEAYFPLKSQMNARSNAKKEAAKAQIVISGSVLASGIMLLTLVTMILVLLSIERNTRPTQVAQTSPP
jgi:hypothetical protein